MTDDGERMTNGWGVNWRGIWAEGFRLGRVSGKGWGSATLKR